jgi:hypothetical protein
LAPDSVSPLPVAYIIGRYCERYHCLPSEMENESAEIIVISKILDMGNALIKRYYG